MKTIQIINNQVYVTSKLKIEEGYLPIVNARFNEQVKFYLIKAFERMINYRTTQLEKAINSDKIYKNGNTLTWNDNDKQIHIFDIDEFESANELINVIQNDKDFIFTNFIEILNEFEIKLIIRILAFDHTIPFEYKDCIINFLIH